MEIVEEAWSSDITFLIPIAFDFSIVTGDQHKGPDIKFSIVVKKGVGYV